VCNLQNGRARPLRVRHVMNALPKKKLGDASSPPRRSDHHQDNQAAARNANPAKALCFVRACGLGSPLGSPRVHMHHAHIYTYVNGCCCSVIFALGCSIILRIGVINWCSPLYAWSLLHVAKSCRMPGWFCEPDCYVLPLCEYPRARTSCVLTCLTPHHTSDL
jgi:hypothetical protein